MAHAHHGKALGWAFAFCAVVSGCALAYAIVVGIGVASMGETTRVVVMMLDDPPRPVIFALFMCAAVAYMYVGAAAFTLCGWTTYRATRAGWRHARAWRLRASAASG